MVEFKKSVSYGMPTAMATLKRKTPATKTQN